MQSMGARKLTIRNFNKERQKDYLVDDDDDDDDTFIKVSRL